MANLKRRYERPSLDLRNPPTPVAVQAMPIKISTGHQTVSLPGSPINTGRESGRPAAIRTTPTTILRPGRRICDRLLEGVLVLEKYLMRCIERPPVAAAN